MLLTVRGADHQPPRQRHRRFDIGYGLHRGRNLPYDYFPRYRTQARRRYLVVAALAAGRQRRLTARYLS